MLTIMPGRTSATRCLTSRDCSGNINSVSHSTQGPPVITRPTCLTSTASSITDDRCSPDTDYNLTVFLARLARQRTFGHSVDIALEMMRLSLEVDHSNQDAETKERLVTIGALWMLHGGQNTYENIVDVPGKIEKRRNQPRPLYKGADLLGDGHWWFWVQRFGELKKDKSLSDECRMLLADAVDEMMDVKFRVKARRRADWDW